MDGMHDMGGMDGFGKVEVVGPLLEDEAAEQHEGVWD